MTNEEDYDRSKKQDTSSEEGDQQTTVAADIEQHIKQSKRNESQEEKTANIKEIDLPAHRHFSVTSDGYKKVYFSENDSENPRNWSNGQKWYLTIFCSYLNVIVASQASVYSPGQMQVIEEFNISEELAIAGLSLYVLGFAIGPMAVAPLSETFGRRNVYLICWGLFTILAFGVAFAPNIATLFVFRFLTGLASSPPLANTGGLISDLWSRDTKSYGMSMAVYTFSSCSGPQWGNLYSGFIAQQLGWRWVFYLTSLLFVGVHFFIILFTLKETRHNVLLERKAARLRKETGDDLYISQDGDEKKTVLELLRISLSRPFIFLATEPITMFAAMWNGLLYGLIFLFNDAFVVVFGPGKGYNWQHVGVVQLTFSAFIIGEFIGFLIYPYTQERYYQYAIRKAGQSVPEARMASGLVGCILLPIGLFIFAWTCDASISFVVPLLGAAIFG